MDNIPVFPSELDKHTSAWGITLKDYVAVEMLKYFLNIHKNNAIAIENAYEIADAFVKYRGLK